jgi:ceramide glucosyltransferase
VIGLILNIQLQMLDFLVWPLLAASAVGCLYLWHACNAVERFSRIAAPSASAPIPVTMLKPLRGEDSALRENLRSFCRQDHPCFQIVFGVADADDPAVPVVRAIMAEFPQHDLSLVIESRQQGANLKIANLGNMLPVARHDVLVIADSDMRVAPNYVAAVTAPLSEGPKSSARPAGLVTCLYRGISNGGLWSDLASMHINYGFLPQALAAQALGIDTGCFGATMALRRATLEATGGFNALADTLADDHELGQAVRRLGMRVELSPYLVDDIVAEPRLSALFRHELRWARTIRLVAPWGFAGSVVTNPVPLAILAAAFGALQMPALGVLAVTLLCRFATTWRIDRALGLDHPSWWLLPVRDLLSFGIFTASFFGRSVAWRDQRFRINPSGQLVADGQSPVMRGRPV